MSLLPHDVCAGGWRPGKRDHRQRSSNHPGYANTPVILGASGLFDLTRSATVIVFSNGGTSRDQTRAVRTMKEIDEVIEAHSGWPVACVRELLSLVVYCS